MYSVCSENEQNPGGLNPRPMGEPMTTSVYSSKAAGREHLAQQMENNCQAMASGIRSSGFLCSLELLKRVCSLLSGNHMVPPFLRKRRMKLNWHKNHLLP